MNNRKPIPELSDEEEARIQAGIAADPDNPEWTAEDFKNARPFAEAFPELARQMKDERDAAAKGGAEYVALDLKVVSRFKQQGPDWRERMNMVLRKAVGL